VRNCQFECNDKAVRKPKKWDKTKIIVSFPPIDPLDKIEARPEFYREVRNFD
jgi:hypothetical protein